MTVMSPLFNIGLASKYTVIRNANVYFITTVLIYVNNILGKLF